MTLRHKAGIVWPVASKNVTPTPHIRSGCVQLAIVLLPPSAFAAPFA